MAKKGATKEKAQPKPKASGGIDPLFVKSKVREYIKNKGCNTAGDVLDGDALNSILIKYIDKAIARAQANNRKTVKARDL